MKTLSLLILAVSLAPLSADEVSIYEYLFEDQAGKEVTLEPYRGRLLVLEFFATWCPPCRKDLPEIAALQKKYETSRVAFLAVSADGPSRTVLRLPEFLEEMELEMPVLIGSDVFVDKFAGVEQKGGRQIVLPQTYVFDQTGELLLRYVGETQNKSRSLALELKRLTEGASE